MHYRRRSLSKEENDEQCKPPPKITLKDDVSSIKTMHAFNESRQRMTTEIFQTIIYFRNVTDLEKKLK